MSDTAESELLSQCFQELTGTSPTSVTRLRPHASERQIYRLACVGSQMIGVINKIPNENEAFVYFAKLFRDLGLPVPEVYLYRPSSHLYLEQDLGDLTLLDLLEAERVSSGEAFPDRAKAIYQRVLEYLPRFQIEAARSIDFSRCFPTTEFSARVLRADMIAFATELVARLSPDYDLEGLEQDFEALITFLMNADSSFFLYRDFQARNIMLVGDQPYFIDFQGGRRGPLQYDVVSLLYQSSAQLPEDVRLDLVSHYLDATDPLLTINREEFYRFYNCFIISRLLQVLGVYGRQGLAAGKEYFRNNIPRAINNLVAELASPSLPIALPRLRVCADVLRECVKEGLSSDI